MQGGKEGGREKREGGRRERENGEGDFSPSVSVILMRTFLVSRLSRADTGSRRTECLCRPAQRTFHVQYQNSFEK